MKLPFNRIFNIQKDETEEEAKKQMSFFEQMFLQSATSTQILDKDGWCLRINPKLSELFGVKAENMEGRKYNIFKDEEIRRQGIDKTLARVFQEKQTVCWEVYFDIGVASESQAIEVKEKKKVWFFNKAYPILDLNGELLYVIIQHENITEKKQAEKAARESAEQFRTLFENTPLGLYRTTPDGRIVKVNQALCRMLGYSSIEELKIQNLEAEEFHPEYSRSSFKDKFNGDNNSISIESMWVRKDGTKIFVRENARAVRDHSGAVLYYDGTIEDITEHKRNEQTLRESEEKYRLLFENNPLPMWIYDLQTLQFLEVNKAAIESYGYSREEFLNMTLRDIRPEADIPALLEDVANTHNSYNAAGSWRHLKKNGQIIYVDIISHSIEFEGKDARLVLSNDITERVKANEELLRAKKEAEKSDRLKSEFLAQMSHEIRSPINTMLNFVSLIKEEVKRPLTEEIEFSFNAIDSSSRRLIRTIDLILNMSQIQTGYLECNYRPLELEKDVLRGIINEYSTPAALKGLSLSFVNDYGAAIVNADMYTLVQIFSNLIDNAIKYTKAGGIAVRIYQCQENKTSVDVSDTGIGISEEYIDYLFTPFTQEEQGYSRKFEGNGLGLALVKKYCELNNAHISVKSKKSQGSIFTVTFNQQ